MPKFTREQREHVEGWLALLPPEYAEACRSQGTVHRWACAPEALITYPRRSPVPTAIRGSRLVYEGWSWAVLWNRLRVHEGALLHQVALYDASRMASEIIVPAYEAHDLVRFDRHLRAVLDQMDACTRDYLEHAARTGDDPLEALAVPRARWGDRTIELRFALVGGVVCVVEPEAAEIPDELRGYLLLERKGGRLVVDAESLEDLPARYPRLSFGESGAVGRCRLVHQVPAEQRRAVIRRRARAALRAW